LRDIWVERRFPFRLVLSAAARATVHLHRRRGAFNPSRLVNHAVAIIEHLRRDHRRRRAGGLERGDTSRAPAFASSSSNKKISRAPKLCGEFISPECQRHFENLGVADAIKISSPAAITETVFYSSTRTSRHHSKQLVWRTAALGLSRAVMDHVLLQRARDCGVTVLEGATITEPILEGRDVRGVKTKKNGRRAEYFAPLTIDATGRAHILTRKLHAGEPRSKAKLIAFKVHSAKHARRTQRVRDLFLPGRLRRTEHHRRRHQQSLFHHLRGTSEASLFKPGSR
jgi:hypothetical protein